MMCHTDVVEEGRKNSEVDTEEALSWTGLGQENHDEERFKFAAEKADEVDYRCRVLSESQVHTCGLRELVEWMWKWVCEDESKARGREGTECLVALLVQFDEVAVQNVQEDTAVCAACDKADSC